MFFRTGLIWILCMRFFLLTQWLWRQDTTSRSTEPRESVRLETRCRKANTFPMATAASPSPCTPKDGRSQSPAPPSATPAGLSAPGLHPHRSKRSSSQIAHLHQPILGPRIRDMRQQIRLVCVFNHRAFTAITTYLKDRSTAFLVFIEGSISGIRGGALVYISR